jgi:hypothetical protein
VYRSDFAIKDSQNSKLGIPLYDASAVKLVRDANDRYTGIYGYSNEEYLYAIDVDNDIGYYFRIPSATTLVMVKRRIRITQYSMFGNTADIIGEPVEISLTTGINVNNQYHNSYNFDPESNALYIVSTLPSQSSSNVAVGNTFTVTKIGLNEAAATQTILINNHTAAINLQSSYVYRGKVYALTSYFSTTVGGVSMYGYGIVSVALDTGEVATHGMITQSSTSSVPRSMYAADGRLYWQGFYTSTKGSGGLQVTDCMATPGDSNTTLCGVDTIDYDLSNSVYYPIACTPVLNHPMIYYVSSGADIEKFVYLAHYLGTVNNLGTPVVKAPTQTMKITYTIQEV